MISIKNAVEEGGKDLDDKQKTPHLLDEGFKLYSLNDL